MNTLLVSCKTTPKNEDTRIQYENHFPAPYDENGNPYVTLEDNDEFVRMPLWYWIKITEYVIYAESNSVLEN